MSGEIEYVDINSDGCKDIDIHTGGYNLVPTHSFWLFNKLNNRFYYSPEFSQLNEFSIVFGKKEIESYSQSTGGRGGSSEKYKIENGSLSLMETEYSNYYDYERQEVINGVLRTVELEKEEWIKDDEDNHMSVIKIYNLVNDSLLLTERNWLTGVNMPYSSDIYDNEIYNCGPWGGCLKYLRKEVYSYDIKAGDYAIKDTLRFEVINNKWEKVKIFKK